MDLQWWVDGLFAVLGMFIVAFYNSLKENMNKTFEAVHKNIKDIEEDTAKLADKVQSIEVIVAGEYVKKSEFEAKVDAMFKKLDIIVDKLDRKADK